MNKRKIWQSFGILALFILGAGDACVNDGVMEDIGQPCFTKESLETVPWIVDVLKPYADPRMGGYHAAVYIYNGQQFLAITFPFGCTPLGHVFNCTGVPLDSLGIDTKDFSDNRKLVAVLSEQKL